MIVVDTNVIAHFFIEGDKTVSARQLWERDEHWRIPHLCRHEFLNVLATYVRSGGMPGSMAQQLWRTAGAILEPMAHEVDMEAALSLAIENGISAYDAQFITLASTLGIHLVTEDRQLRERFPDIAIAL